MIIDPRWPRQQARPSTLVKCKMPLRQRDCPLLAWIGSILGGSR